MQETTENIFEVNPNANLSNIGTRVSEALFAIGENDTDSVYDNLLEIHSEIYSKSYRLATEEENAALAAMEPPAGIQPYSPLILDETDVPVPHEHASLDILKQTLDQIIDGEKEPAAFLEALEITWKIAHECSRAMEKAGAIMNQNVQLQEQNRQLAGLLFLNTQDMPIGKA